MSREFREGEGKLVCQDPKTWTLLPFYQVWRGHETQTKPVPELDSRPNRIPLSGYRLDTDPGIGEMNKNEGTAIKKMLAHEEKNAAIVTVIIMTVV